MANLLITKAKPNPAGKDRIGRTLTPAIQLAAEWVDFQNISNISVKLDGTSLYHWAYTLGTNGEWKLVTNLSGILKSGEIVRVHSGNPIPIWQMRQEDQIGANYHIFSNQNYVWNNDKADFPSLWYVPTRQWVDQTSYDAYPMEGKILQRINSKLI